MWHFVDCKLVDCKIFTGNSLNLNELTSPSDSVRVKRKIICILKTIFNYSITIYRFNISYFDHISKRNLYVSAILYSPYSYQKSRFIAYGLHRGSKYQYVPGNAKDKHRHPLKAKTTSRIGFIHLFPLFDIFVVRKSRISKV